jgi:hypothetical protein
MPSVEHELNVEMLSGGLGLDELSLDDRRAVMEAKPTALSCISMAAPM